VANANDLERSTGGDDEHLQFERLDGTPADPPSFKTTVLGWNLGDRIHGVVGFPSTRGRSLLNDGWNEAKWTSDAHGCHQPKSGQDR
jgi:hypothetical protein